MFIDSNFKLVKMLQQEKYKYMDLARTMGKFMGGGIDKAKPNIAKARALGFLETDHLHFIRLKKQDEN